MVVANVRELFQHFKKLGVDMDFFHTFFRQ